MNAIARIWNALLDATINREREYTVMLLGEKLTRHVDLVVRPNAQRCVTLLEGCGQYIVDVYANRNSDKGGGGCE